MNRLGNCDFKKIMATSVACFIPFVYYIFKKYIFDKTPEHIKCSENEKKEHRSLKTSRSCNTDNTNCGGDFLQVKIYDNDIDVLNEMKAEDWIYDKDVVKLNESMTVNQALEIMSNTKNTCALLYSNSQTLLGVLDTPDILSFLLRTSASINSSARQLVRNCIVAPGHVSVNEICRHLCCGTRHIAVYKNYDYQIVSQRAMVEAIFHAVNNDFVFQNVLSKTISDVKIGTMKNIISCSDTFTTREAFELMSAYDITSLPILDGEQNVIGVISATDALYTRKDIQMLDKNIMDFMVESRKDADIDRGVDIIVSCNYQDTVIQILTQMMHEKVHHIYLLENNKLKGVISFVDILKYFSKNI